MGKQYPIRLVGEEHYDAACSACKIGQPVAIFHEIGNPFDEEALVAKNRLGQTIGYVPRDSFVQGVFHNQDRSVFAVIDYMSRENGRWQIGLSVEVIDEPGETVKYKRAEPERVHAITRRASLPDDDDAPAAAAGTIYGMPIWLLILAAAAAMLWLVATRGG